MLAHCSLHDFMSPTSTNLNETQANSASIAHRLGNCTGVDPALDLNRTTVTLSLLEELMLLFCAL